MPSNTIPKQILLRGDPVYFEALCNATPMPGQLMQLNSSGKLIAHASAAGVGAPIVLLEEEYVGGDIDTAYAANDTGRYCHGKSGDQFYMFLKNGQNVALGAYLESDGAGALQATTHAVTSATTAAAWPLFIAVEAVNNSGGGTGPNSSMRIRAAVL